VPDCPTCGKALAPDVRFCPDDGTPLTDTAARAATPTTAAAPAAAPTPALVLPVTVGNRYKLLELRGGGGMAQVFRGLDTTLERPVAVKLMNANLRADPQFDARFQREARIASQLADPHIVVVHDFGIDATHGPFLVMEYLEGQSLGERLTEAGPLPYAAGLQLGAQLLLALIHAHEKGVIHRDIKPDNVFLLNQSGVKLHVRVLDFGIARMVRRDDTAPGTATAELTLPGSVLGTPKYMAPEQLAGGQVDHRADIYGAAVVMYEALTGTVPQPGKALRELCPPASPELETLLEHCLRRRPDHRPASAAEVYLRLHELGKASGALLVSPETLKQLTARFKQAVNTQTTQTFVPPAAIARRWLVTAVMAVIVVLAGYLLFGR
jgi:serine/threonine-protein kinase